jgi:hypothetical protein
MRNRALTLGLFFLALAGVIGWQVGACYVANSELQSDMQDLAVQNPFRIGLAPAPTEEGLRDSVIAKAKDHGIQLQPEQVAVQYTFTPDLVLSVSLAANYEARVNLLVYSFTLHFTPSGSHSGKVIVK